MKNNGIKNFFDPKNNNMTVKDFRDKYGENNEMEYSTGMPLMKELTDDNENMNKAVDSLMTERDNQADEIQKKDKQIKELEDKLKATENVILTIGKLSDSYESSEIEIEDFDCWLHECLGQALSTIKGND